VRSLATVVASAPAQRSEAPLRLATAGSSVLRRWVMPLPVRVSPAAWMERSSDWSLLRCDCRAMVKQEGLATMNCQSLLQCDCRATVKREGLATILQAMVRPLLRASVKG
jgi:hypothetical protein